MVAKWWGWSVGEAGSDNSCELSALTIVRRQTTDLELLCTEYIVCLYSVCQQY